MNKLLFVATAILLIIPGLLFSQTAANRAVLQTFSAEKDADFTNQKNIATQYALRNNIPLTIQTGTTFMELMQVDADGQLYYYTTHNANSAKTTSTNKVHPAAGFGFALDGAGMTVHEWDAGAVLANHQEYSGRVTQVDNAYSTHYHATHVAGTMIASGVQSAAKGMAPAAHLNAYDWNNDESEMAAAGANGALVSNHSYGYANGWSWNGSSWVWYGDPTISTTEDYSFGFYDSQAQDWDFIAHNAPYYLIVKSAGNDRGDGPTGGTYPQDGPYDCIGNAGVAKNILTVGAVNDITSGYSQPSDVVMSSFSSWGPADDGRVKPDIVANGVSLYSSDDGGNSSYATLSGTSMSSPSATGSLILLQQHYQAMHGTGNLMKAATLKALVIHTADEAGPDPGPDYMFGWGLLNTYKATQKITESNSLDVINEYNLTNGSTYTRTVQASGDGPLVVTIVWTDVPGTPVAQQLDPPDPMIVNDLDLRVTRNSSTWYPWKLNPNNPSAAATRAGKNYVDNVENLIIDNPIAGQSYTIVVDHAGVLSGGSQPFSMIVSGITQQPTAPPVVDFYTPNTTVFAGADVQFTDLSTQFPNTWSWTFQGALPATSAQRNPIAVFNTPGTYDVSLTASNALGSDTETKIGYITVVEMPITYCTSSGNNSSSEWISQTQFNDFSNPSGAAGYTDFTNLVLNWEPGETINFTLTPGFGWFTYTEYWRIWIDYNKDGDFVDNGELVFTSAGSKQPVSGSFVVPTTATGTTRMRVTMKYNGAPDPCGTFNYGEVEDYSVHFVAPPLSATIDLPEGWSGFSLPFEPEQTTIDDMFGAAANNIIILQNYNSIYWPAMQINTFTGWDAATAGQLKMAQSHQLTLQGTASSRTLTFDAGWNYLPVTSLCNVNLTELLTPVMDKVVMVKSIGDILVFWPDASVYTLQVLQPGKAYFVNFDMPVSITFPECPAKSLKTQILAPDTPQRWPIVSPTAVSHTIRVDASVVDGLEPGDILGAFTTSGQCAGAVTLTGSADALVLWGDDAATTAKEGFAVDETITFRHYAAATGQEQTCEVVFDEMFPQKHPHFIANGMSAINAIDFITTINAGKATSISVSPNPSSGVFNIQNLNGNETVEVSRLDGTTITTLLPQATSCKLDLSRQAAGIYLLKITSERSFQAIKIIIR
ncbi:MAG: S8 family serine peptidase [Bacteroidales bacterium]|jgi:PKD repeat protein|nr:S8 family serine peptidase [Bacteroidales bacterium]MDD3130411.1 S8 family serine peptidase [Bacteroidales bacterium]MDD4177198.1 S8 family serine peptidase [Bacteroidales bacterium]MDD4742014.1 S8 family serine peptidase [Bacteroidales bacterium]MDY0335442.1 S8 family serine peptidase [Bacteroidales bacterium]